MTKLDQTQGGKLNKKKSRFVSVLKRFLSRTSKDTKTTEGIDDYNSFKEVLSKQVSDSEEEQGPMISQVGPEILRVSPMHKSCEVTLISSSFDESTVDEEDSKAHYKITVNNGNEKDFDESYHVVLNPHRPSRTSYYFFDDEKHHRSETGSNDITRDTCDESCSSDSDHGVDKNNGMNVAGSDIEKYFDIDGIVDKRDDYKLERARQDFIFKKDSEFYESLFIASDSDEEGEDYNIGSLEVNNQWLIQDEENIYKEVSTFEAPHARSGIISITLDKSLEYDLESLRSADGDHSIQFIVENISF
eukprot:jgi/Psemu1/284882/fgenesh1_pg.67_\